MRDKLISIILWVPPQAIGSLSRHRISFALFLEAVYKAQSQLSTCLFISTFQALVSGILCHFWVWLTAAVFRSWSFPVILIKMYSCFYLYLINLLTTIWTTEVLWNHTKNDIMKLWHPIRNCILECFSSLIPDIFLTCYCIDFETFSTEAAEE